MAFPAIATTRANGTAYSTSNFTFGAMPTGTTSGDLLVAFGHTIDNNADYTDPSGWTRKASASGNSGRSFVWARVATGTDPLVFPLSESGDSISIVVARITGWTGSDTASVEATVAVDFSGSGDPASLTATWGSADNLWLAVCGREGNDITTYPTGYSGGVTGYNGGVWGAVALAYKESASATENPGTGFGTGGATVHVGTIAIRGSAASTVTGGITLEDLVLSGAFATGALSQLGSGFTLDNFALAGFLGLAPGRVDTQPFKNWSGTLLPGITVPNVVFLKLDRSTALALASQATDGAGVMTVTNAALVAGTFYVMVSFDATGANIGAELVLAT
jgi:hypothetical protein